MLRMMAKMKTLGGIAALIAALMLPMTVQAAETSVLPDETIPGTVTITLKDIDSGENVPGGTVIAEKVGKVVVVDGGNYYFEPVDELKDSGISFEDVASPDLAVELAKYIADNKIALTTVREEVSGDGFVAFPDLSIGLWLFENTEPAEDYELFSPFVVTVPYMNDETGLYEYEIDATPKVGVKKIVTTPTPSITVTPTPSTVTPSTATPRPSTARPTPKPTLPQTGQLWWPVPVLAIAGAAFVLFGWLRRRSR